MPSDPNRLKQALLSIPPQGATVGTLSRLWGMSVQATSRLLKDYKGVWVKREWRRGVRYWSPLPEKERG